MLRTPKNVPDWTVFWLHDTACWALGRLWPSDDDDEDEMYSICMLAGVLQRAGLTNQFWVAPVNNHRVVFFSEDDDDNNDDDNDEEDVGSSDLYAD